MSVIFEGNPQNLNLGEPGCYAIGYFDGVHKAHQALINKTIECARDASMKPGILTFNSLLYTKSIPLRGLLTTHEEKKAIINHLGIESICILNFVDRLRDMDPKQFVTEILKERLKARTILVGPGFRFGKGGKGEPKDLVKICNQSDIDVVVIPSATFEGKPISSTRIRMNLLYSGDIQKANTMLGRQYSITGVVTKGAGVGRSIGFPTANLKIESFRKLIPADGVYACFARLKNRTLKSSVSIGNRSTFKDNHRSIEAYLLDYSGDCYNETIEISFASRIRSQRQFESPDKLVEQIEKDVSETRKILGGTS
jgi:riboflavin kinase / FMN adenylyltransferase